MSDSRAAYVGSSSSVRSLASKRASRLRSQRVPVSPGPGTALGSDSGQPDRYAFFIPAESDDSRRLSGKGNAEIAAALYLSTKTVKNSVTRILKKLQLRNRIEAAVYAARHGLAE